MTVSPAAGPGLSKGCKSFFYWSTDKCHSWRGPFAIPMFGRTGVAVAVDETVILLHRPL